MSNACLQVTTHSQVDRQRQLAWQVALFYPCVVILLTSLIGSQAARPLWLTVSGILLLSLVITASITDMLWRKIPNWATYTAVVWALLINGFASFANEGVVATLGAVGLWDSLAGATIPFFFMLIIFSVTGGGAGDIKLTAAMGALLGLDRVVDAILLSFIFAGAFAFMRAVWLQGPVSLFTMSYRGLGHRVFPMWIQPPSEEQRKFLREPMPLGPAFAAGTMLVLFDLNLESLVVAAKALWGGL